VKRAGDWKFFYDVGMMAVNNEDIAYEVFMSAKMWITTLLDILKNFL
jgi:hypothetical protein